MLSRACGMQLMRIIVARQRLELGFLGTERGENGFCDWDESYLGLVGQYLISLSSIGRQRPGPWTVP